MRLIVLLLAVLCALTSSRLQALEAVAEHAVDYLLRYIPTSHASFGGNGREYSAQEGAEHMHQKLERAGARAKFADEFVRGVAAGPWLAAALEQYRKRRR